MACDSPYYVKTSKGSVLDKVPVPCGRCPPCKLRRVNEWVFRMLQEDKVSFCAYFITLTYETHSVPISKHGFMTLKKKDFQNFMKRLRKEISITNPHWPHKIKYYCAGEYGSERSRPHYHVIIFNVPDPSLFQKAWTLDGRPIGNVDVGSLTSASIAYTLKYIDKSNFQKRHKRDDRLPEFSLMSKGLGKSYLTQEVIRYHKQNIGTLYVTKTDGRRVPMPRYYRNRIFSDDEKEKQIEVIKNAVALDDLKKRQDIARRIKGRNITVDSWIEGEKYARYDDFYHKLKKKRQ